MWPSWHAYVLCVRYVFVQHLSGPCDTRQTPSKPRFKKWNKKAHQATAITDCDKWPIVIVRARRARQINRYLHDHHQSVGWPHTHTHGQTRTLSPAHRDAPRDHPIHSIDYHSRFERATAERINPFGAWNETRWHWKFIANANR